MKIAILGYGVEGKSAERFLRKQLGNLASELEIELRDVKLQGENYLKDLEKFDIIVRSPGIPYLTPELQRAQKKGIEITSATKLFFQNAKGILVGITGTKGKGTASTLLYKILKGAKKDVHLIGNMGIPMLDELPKLRKNSISVLELSSFQLQDMNISPHIAAVLDVSPDHLNYHKSMKEYVNAKAQLVKNRPPKPEVFQDFSQRDGVRLSNSPAGEYAGLEKSAGEAKIFYFPDNKYSRQIAQKSKGKKIAVFADKKLKLKIPGAHNLKNASMAAAIGRVLGAKENVIRKTTQNFKGLPNRLEFVQKIHGIRFYNDSASTNPAATAAALAAFREPKILIAGGAGKNLDYKPIGKALQNSNTKLVILYGHNKKEIGRAVGMVSPYYSTDSKKSHIRFTDNLKSAVQIAFREARKGDVVLLSPASTAFDRFSGYAERGTVFKKCIAKLR